jgi:hypothetical protein
VLLDLISHAHTVASTVLGAGHHQLLAADPPSPAPGGGGGGVLTNIGPDKNAPGATAFQSVVGALMFYGLLGGLGGLFLSALVFSLGRWFSNHHAAVAGRMGMLASLGCAILVGGGTSLINWAFALGASINA